MAGVSLINVTINGELQSIKEGGILHKQLVEAGLVKAEIGLSPDETCNRKGCQGTMQDQRDGGCSCHCGNPPCGYCTYTFTRCDECDEEYEFKA